MFKWFKTKIAEWDMGPHGPTKPYALQYEEGDWLITHDANGLIWYQPKITLNYLITSIGLLIPTLITVLLWYLFSFGWLEKKKNAQSQQKTEVKTP